MTTDGIGEDVRQFIFESIDSVEQLEVLIYLRHHPDTSHFPEEISQVMRSTPESVAVRMLTLERQGFITGDRKLGFKYRPDLGADDVIGRAEESFRSRPHTVMEMIFSPMKKARGFAEAFIVKRRKSEDPNG